TEAETSAGYSRGGFSRQLAEPSTGEGPVRDEIRSSTVSSGVSQSSIRRSSSRSTSSSKSSPVLLGEPSPIGSASSTSSWGHPRSPSSVKRSLVSIASESDESK